MTRHFDIIVIGASLAGSAAAIILAKSGAKVALIDKANFPRSKPCGEGLSALSLQALTELGALEAVTALPHVPLRGFEVHRRGRNYQLLLKSNQKVGMGVARYLLDQTLHGLALASPEVSCFEGFSVREVISNTTSMLVRADSGDQSEQLFSAPYLILADGGRSPISRQLGIPVSAKPINRYGYRLLLTGQPKRSIEAVQVFVRGDHEVYCTPVGEGRINLALLGSKRAVSEMANSNYRAQIVGWIAEELGIEGVQFNEGQAIGPVTRLSRNSVWGRTFLVGDAAESFDPLGGMGMTHALYSGIAAGEALTGILLKQETMQAGAHRYVAERERIARTLRTFTSLTYRAFRNREGGILLSLLARGKSFAVLERTLQIVFRRARQTTFSKRISSNATPGPTPSISARLKGAWLRVV